MHWSFSLSRLVFPAFICFFCLANQSPATPYNLGVANDFNAFIFGTHTAAGGDTEGRLAVGGNFTASSYAVGPALPNSAGARNDLIVGGNMNAIGGWQVPHGNAVWGTSLTAAPTTPNGNSTFQGTPINFAAAQADLIAKSTAWAALPANGSSVFMFSTLTLTGADPMLNVFTVAENAWENSTDKQINVPFGSTALINILGTNVSQSGGMTINGSGSQSNPQGAFILYHYPQATAVNSSNIALIGSALAPYAHLELSGGNINGVSVFASSNTFNGGEFHNYPFNGVVPEPGSIVLALGCLLGLGWKLRRG